MESDSSRERIRTDEDFIALKRYEFSLKNLRAKYKDDPIPNKLIASALLISEEELEAEYERIVKKLQLLMVPKLADIEVE